MFKYRIAKREKYIGMVTEMYFKEGESLSAISRKISVPCATIRNWISIFAEGKGISMKPSGKLEDRVNESIGIFKSAREGDDEKTLMAEIRRLERELKRERLRADLNEEIINVAEQKFNIRIRKKAGAKR